MTSTAAPASGRELASYTPDTFRAPMGEREGAHVPIHWMVAIAVTLVGLMLLDGYPLGGMFDDAQYVILAKALATGEGLRWIHVPGAPVATHFPPGYPAVLALLWKLWPSFPDNVILFKAANAIFLGFAGAGMTRLGVERLGLPARGAAALAVAGVLGIPMLVLSTSVMSETLFLAMLLATVLVAESLAERPRPASHVLLLGLAIGAVTLVRTHGVALAGAVVLVLALRRRWRDVALTAGGTSVLLLPWLLFVGANQGVVPPAMRGNYESYSSWLVAGVQEQGLSLFTATIARTAFALVGMLRVLFAPEVPTAVAVAALAALALLLPLGAWRLWKRAPVTAAFMGGYLAMVLLWPFAPSRFIWAVWPLVLALPVLALHWLLQQHPTRRPLSAARAVLAASALLLLVGHAVYTAQGVRGGWWSSINRAAADELVPLVRWVRSSTSPRDVVASHAEGAIYLYAERQTVPSAAFRASDFLRDPAPETRVADLSEILDSYRIGAVLISRGSSAGVGAAARALTEQRPPRLMVRDTLPGGIVLSPVPVPPVPSPTRHVLP